MLHNSGPYGPNDTPVNMGAPINMTSLNPVNIAHNINNLGKVGHPTHPPGSGHYNIPNYPNYNHHALNMTAQMNNFSNYHPIGYQSSFTPQNSPNLHDTNWHNGMLPMNLNVPSDHQPNMLNYHPYDKRLAESVNEIKDPSGRKSVPLNIPQIPTKAFHKQGMGNDGYMYNDNRYDPHNLDRTKNHEKTFDNRKKSLENTVKLIENILINSTSKKEMNNTNLNTNEPVKCDTVDVIKNSVLKETATTQSTNLTTNVINESQDVTTCNVEDKSNENNDTNYIEIPVISMNKDSDASLVKNEIKNELTCAEAPRVVVNDIIIKVEATTWADTESSNPFHRDPSGIMREDAKTNFEIIDTEHSITDAQEIIKKEQDVPTKEVYYECPHCSILIKHPKRFLIHSKWHTFGLTNDRRMEVIRERELKKAQKKEAKILKRLSAKEVDADSDGIKYPCKDCDKIFAAKASLKNHRQKFHPTRTRECKICKKTVLGWMALRAHLATHTNETGYQCADCPKRFKYAHSLAKHRDTHLEKTHGCEQCPKMFGSQALLKMHMKCHERVLRGATFRCTYCGKGFFESYNLQVHERTHRNERPFLCDICNTSFGTNSSLKRHLKVSHSTSKPFECPTCHRSFVSESIRDRHELRAHGNPEDFKFHCKQCPCRYLRQKDLTKHVYSAHPKGKRRKRTKGGLTDTE